VKAVPLERRGDFVITMYELDEDVCRRMLAACTFGRVAFDDEVDGVTILPVNCVATDNGAVAFRCRHGSVLDRVAADGRAVAFQADDVDPSAESGWSVLVRGTASYLCDPDLIAGLADTTVHPWAPGRRDRWVEIVPVRITGRIIKRRRLPGRSRLPAIPPD
jgi:nitroimidazol reductase NimA-like FMN-containing flavoprotein (pyridoxamine 5'-phosphate oxidase superfamily)